jgi:hypothetical protein
MQPLSTQGILYSQTSPVYPVAQLQLKFVSSVFSHVPLFAHGRLSHGDGAGVVVGAVVVWTVVVCTVVVVIGCVVVGGT